MQLCKHQEGRKHKQKMYYCQGHGRAEEIIDNHQALICQMSTGNCDIIMIVIQFSFVISLNLWCT